MQKRPAMKSLIDMTHTERMAALMRELRSPKGVATAIALVEQIKQELKEAEDGYQIALQLQGLAARPQNDPLSRSKVEEPSREDERKARRSTAGNTVTKLVDRYRTHPGSPYLKLRHTTRAHYDGNIRRILEVCGEARLADLRAPDIQNYYDGWAGPERKLSMAHSLITILRVIVNFGATVLEDDDCIRLAVVMHRMALPGSKKPTARVDLTRQQITDFCNTARKMGFASIALAQAFRIDCGLMPKDIVGEWAPMSEPGAPSEIIDESGDSRWLRGIRWHQIDENFVLRHNTSRYNEPVEFDLKAAPFVTAGLSTQDDGALTRSKLPASGAIIVCERTGRPWNSHYFRETWRKIANAAGLPKKANSVSGLLEDDENEDRAAEVRPAARS